MLEVFKSNKNKCIGLLAGTFLGLILIYQVALKKTINLHKTFQRNNALILQSKSIDRQLEKLELKLGHLQASSIQPYDRENLLDQVTSFCKSNRLLVNKFPEASLQTVDKKEIVTNKIEITGPYHAIVKLTHLIEREKKLVAIGSLDFQLKKNKKSKKQELIASIIIRNLTEKL